MQEIEALCIMHETISRSSECRDFNHRAALLLQRLEDAGYSRLADRAMGLLAACNPKDLSQCDSIHQARDILERLRVLARGDLEKDNEGHYLLCHSLTSFASFLHHILNPRYLTA